MTPPTQQLKRPPFMRAPHTGSVAVTGRRAIAAQGTTTAPTAETSRPRKGTRSASSAALRKSPVNPSPHRRPEARREEMSPLSKAAQA